MRAFLAVAWLTTPIQGEAPTAANVAISKLTEEVTALKAEVAYYAQKAAMLEEQLKAAAQELQRSRMHAQVANAKQQVQPILHTLFGTDHIARI